MPELPEVECVRRSLEAVLPGRRIEAVDLRRASVVTGACDAKALLRGATITALLRHGKHLAFVAQRGCESPALDVHLGMTGSCQHERDAAAALSKHAHVVWSLDDGSRLVFEDPRRFGGVWTFRDLNELRYARWTKLGPDALSITADQLNARLRGRKRGVWATLLDQQIVAGLGNIYVTETLFLRRLRPQRQAGRLSLGDVAELVQTFQDVLGQALARGGSTLRDYVDGQGVPGSFQELHQVYGRVGQRCRCCDRTIQSVRLNGRTAAYCPGCQR